jgi:hypothetical protein
VANEAHRGSKSESSSAISLELGLNPGRSLQVRFRPAQIAHLRFVAGKVELNTRPAARVRIVCGRGLIQCAWLRIFDPVSRWNGF